MRDQHRPKQDLLNEVAGLRKQVADLKEAMIKAGVLDTPTIYFLESID